MTDGLPALVMSDHDPVVTAHGADPRVVPAQRGGAKTQPTNTDATRFDIGVDRLGGETPNFDLPGARDTLTRGKVLTQTPTVPRERVYPNSPGCGTACP